VARTWLRGNAGGYIVSFAPFHERGFATPPHPFLRGLLHHYRIELQHLNPNGIQHITAFVTLCEGYLRIEPHFDLWKYFFTVYQAILSSQGKAGCTAYGRCNHAPS
jgi:hypothetical protein